MDALQFGLAHEPRDPLAVHHLTSIVRAPSGMGGETVTSATVDLRVRKLGVACRCESGPGSCQEAR
jgi:hypothetical protein